MKKGQILVETIIGIGVIAFVLAAIVPLFVVGLKGGTESWRLDSARLLAQESMTAAKALKEENWNNLYRPLGTSNKGPSNPYHVITSNGSWILGAGSQEISLNNLIFSREIIIENVSRTQVNGAGDLEAEYHSERDDPSTLKVTSKVTWPGSQGVELIDYFSRHQNFLWPQTDWSGGSGQANWQDPPGNTYFSHSLNFSPTGDVDATSTPGALKLAQIATSGSTPYGNEFIIDSLATIYRLNNPNYKLSMRFTAQKSGSVNQLRVYLDSVRRGNRVYYRYGLQEDSAFNPGYPSGTFLASGTANFNSTGWQQVNLSSPANLTAGSVYHLVVEYASGQAPANSRYIDIRSSAPTNGLLPLEMSSDLSANCLRYDGASWALLDQQPIYVLGFSDNTHEGNPYDNFADWNIYGNNFAGEIFTVNEDMEAVGAGLYLASSRSNLPADNLYVSLINVTDDEILVDSQTFIEPINLTTTFEWKRYNFSATQTLEEGKTYRLVFSSPGSNQTRNYLVKNLSNPDEAIYNSLNWQDTDAVLARSANGGASYSNYTFIDLSYYLLISGGLSYADDGELISATFDTANPGGGGFNRLSWSLVGALPANTTVSLQLAANDDNATWNWSGPNGPGTWYTLSTGEGVWAGLYGESAPQPSRFLRYKIRLATADNSITPIVDWVRINWSQ